jgi:hypothetical protein
LFASLYGVGYSPPKHKVFVSYHHANDWFYREQFEDLFCDISEVFISKSVQIGEIPIWLDSDTTRQKIRKEYLCDSTVTVVLIGTQTWQRRHVDWEISSSIRADEAEQQIRPPWNSVATHHSYQTPQFDGGTVPPRLVDNQVCGFASIYDWSDNPADVARWIEIAFDRRETVEPDNSYPHYVNNKTGDRWR